MVFKQKTIFEKPSLLRSGKQIRENQDETGNSGCALRLRGHNFSPMSNRYPTYLFFGAPGSGKGTQGVTLGTLPGFFHCACGDVFRRLDTRTELGQKFLEYSSKGELVPDEITIQLWMESIQGAEANGRFKPDVDYLLLDGIPRNIAQARLMEDIIEVRHVFHLSCPDREKIVARLKKRALKDNRLDDANEEVIRRRLLAYEQESKPLLEYYGAGLITDIDATQYPVKVMKDILDRVVEDRKET